MPKVETPAANLSEAMRYINSQYARSWNRRRRTRGHVFGDRFVSKPIEDDRYALTALKYITWNPVESGYVKHPDDWVWSSHRATAGLAAPPEFLDLDWLQGFFGRPTLAEAQLEYRKAMNRSIYGRRVRGLSKYDRRWLGGLPGSCARANRHHDARSDHSEKLPSPGAAIARGAFRWPDGRSRGSKPDNTACAGGLWLSSVRNCAHSESAPEHREQDREQAQEAKILPREGGLTSRSIQTSVAARCL